MLSVFETDKLLRAFVLIEIYRRVAISQSTAMTGITSPKADMVPSHHWYTYKNLYASIPVY